MNCRIIDSSDKIWKHLLSISKYDIYHIPCFNGLESEILAGKSKAFLIENGNELALIPIIQRRIPFLINNEQRYDAVSPYGYSGILFSNNFSMDTINNLLELVQKCGSDAGLISTFIRLHPISNSFEIMHSDLIKFMQIGNSIAVKCDDDFEDIFHSFSSNHKKNIKKLLKNEIYFEIDNWRDYNRFQYLYSDTMRRVSAAQYYYYDKKYFDDLKICLRNSLHLISIKDKNRNILSAGIFSSINSIAQSILTSTNKNYQKLAPSKLLFYGMIKWCNENNVKLLNLGGGVGSQKDSLYNFKLGFGKEVFPFNGVGIIHDINVYKELESNCSKNDFNSNYFPCYRATN